MKLSTEEISALAAQFAPEGISSSPAPFGGGHINDTYRFALPDGAYCVIQRINRNAFPHPEQVMENMIRVTDYLRGQIALRGGDTERETLHLLKTPQGRYSVIDRNGDYWRCYRFVADSASYERSENEQIFRESGHAFGRFLSMLDGFDATSLWETIVRFHDTPSRFADFRAAVERDAVGRLDGVREMVEQALDYEPFADTLTGALARGELPLRVTHNDTKLNNALIDTRTGRALCVIDLDTVMPGLAAYDFGDAIRFGASTAAEDEPDLDKVHFSLPLYRAYAEGFLAETRDTLTPAEVESLPIGARMMTLETTIRFLGDYLNGDVYFKTAYPEHNLVRARTQLKLLTEMDSRREDMAACVRELAAKKG